MAQIDEWLAQAARITRTGTGAPGTDAIDRAIATGPSPTWIAHRRGQRRSALCAGIAALIGFGGSGAVATAAFARPAPTWVSSPPPTSPYGLLIGG